MLIQDIVAAAKHSELSSLAVRDDTATLIAFLNLGMLELYKRFPLKVKEHVIEMKTGYSLYYLPTDFMYYLSAYTKVTDPVNGPVALKVNDEGADDSVFIPNHTQIQIPAVAVTDVYGNMDNVSLIYVCKPLKYTVDDMGTEIDLPDTLVEPLLHYMGYRGHLGVRGDANAETNAHYIRFERSCKAAKDLGVGFSMTSFNMMERITDRGFA